MCGAQIEPVDVGVGKGGRKGCQGADGGNTRGFVAGSTDPATALKRAKRIRTPQPNEYGRDQRTLWRSRTSSYAPWS
jgi:hypothetical protein